MSTVAGVISKCAYAEQRGWYILHPDRRARALNDCLATRVHHVVVYSSQTKREGTTPSFAFVLFVITGEDLSDSALKQWLHHRYDTTIRYNYF